MILREVSISLPIVYELTAKTVPRVTAGIQKRSNLLPIANLLAHVQAYNSV